MCSSGILTHAMAKVPLDFILEPYQSKYFMFAFLKFPGKASSEHIVTFESPFNFNPITCSSLSIYMSLRPPFPSDSDDVLLFAGRTLLRAVFLLGLPHFPLYLDFFNSFPLPFYLSSFLCYHLFLFLAHSKLFSICYLCPVYYVCMKLFHTYKMIKVDKGSFTIFFTWLKKQSIISLVNSFSHLHPLHSCPELINCCLT